MDKTQQLQDEFDKLAASVNPDEAHRTFEVACRSGFLAAQQELSKQFAITTLLKRLLERCRDAEDSERQEEYGYTICCMDLEHHINHHTPVPEYRRLQAMCLEALEIQEKVTAEMSPKIDQLWVKSMTVDQIRKQLTILEDCVKGHRSGDFMESIKRRLQLCREALHEKQNKQ